jgi:Ca2+-binding EF-hand superfamily protein
MEYHESKDVDLMGELKKEFNFDAADQNDVSQNEFYTPQAMMRRGSLQFDEKLNACLKAIWNHFDSDQSGGLDEKEYSQMHKQMFIAVHKSARGWSQSMVKEDWDADRGDYGHLNYKRFKKCWFTVADRFTDTLDANEYALFLYGVIKSMGLTLKKERKGADFEAELSKMQTRQLLIKKDRAQDSDSDSGSEYSWSSESDWSRPSSAHSTVKRPRSAHSSRVDTPDPITDSEVEHVGSTDKGRRPSAARAQAAAKTKDAASPAQVKQKKTTAVRAAPAKAAAEVGVAAADPKTAKPRVGMANVDQLREEDEAEEAEEPAEPAELDPVRGKVEVRMRKVGGPEGPSEAVDDANVSVVNLELPASSVLKPVPTQPKVARAVAAEQAVAVEQSRDGGVPMARSRLCGSKEGAAALVGGRGKRHANTMAVVRGGGGGQFDPSPLAPLSLSLRPGIDLPELKDVPPPMQGVELADDVASPTSVGERAGSAGRRPESPQFRYANTVALDSSPAARETGGEPAAKAKSSLPQPFDYVGEGFSAPYHANLNHWKRRPSHDRIVHNLNLQLTKTAEGQPEDDGDERSLKSVEDVDLVLPGDRLVTLPRLDSSGFVVDPTAPVQEEPIQFPNELMMQLVDTIFASSKVLFFKDQLKEQQIKVEELKSSRCTTIANNHAHGRLKSSVDTTTNLEEAIGHDNTENELREVLQNALSNGVNLEDAFKVFDKKGNGNVSIDEFSGVLAELGFGDVDKDAIGRLVRKLNGQHLNTVSYVDFVKLVKGRKNGHHHHRHHHHHHHHHDGRRGKNVAQHRVQGQRRRSSAQPQHQHHRRRSHDNHHHHHHQHGQSRSPIHMPLSASCGFKSMRKGTMNTHFSKSAGSGLVGGMAIRAHPLLSPPGRYRRDHEEELAQKDKQPIEERPWFQTSDFQPAITQSELASRLASDADEYQYCPGDSIMMHASALSYTTGAELRQLRPSSPSSLAASAIPTVNGAVSALTTKKVGFPGMDTRPATSQGFTYRPSDSATSTFGETLGGGTTFSAFGSVGSIGDLNRGGSSGLDPRPSGRGRFASSRSQPQSPTTRSILPSATVSEVSSFFVCA